MKFNYFIISFFITKSLLFWTDFLWEIPAVLLFTASSWATESIRLLIGFKSLFALFLVGPSNNLLRKWFGTRLWLIILTPDDSFGYFDSLLIISFVELFWSWELPCRILGSLGSFNLPSFLCDTDFLLIRGKWSASNILKLWGLKFLFRLWNIYTSSGSLPLADRV